MSVIQFLIQVAFRGIVLSFEAFVPRMVVPLEMI